MKSILKESRFLELVRRLDTLEAGATRRWGTLSAHGMVCHLNDAFLTMLGDRPSDRQSTLSERTLLRFFALHLPFPWPKGVKGPAVVNQGEGGTPPVDFDADMESLRSSMARFAASVDPSAMRHPFFGQISAREWGIWGYRHVDHHLRQFGV